jgi:hypothetical protein
MSYDQENNQAYRTPPSRDETRKSGKGVAQLSGSFFVAERSKSYEILSCQRSWKILLKDHVISSWREAISNGVSMVC